MSVVPREPLVLLEQVGLLDPLVRVVQQVCQVLLERQVKRDLVERLALRDHQGYPVLLVQLEQPVLQEALERQEHPAFRVQPVELGLKVPLVLRVHLALMALLELQE